MFYQAFAGVPEWAPPYENHILYSAGVVKNVRYEPGKVRYTCTLANSTEYLRLAFKPSFITVDGRKILPGTSDSDSYTIRKLGQTDYAVTIRHQNESVIDILE